MSGHGNGAGGDRAAGGKVGADVVPGAGAGRRGHGDGCGGGAAADPRAAIAGWARNSTWGSSMNSTNATTRISAASRKIWSIARRSRTGTAGPAPATTGQERRVVQRPAGHPAALKRRQQRPVTGLPVTAGSVSTFAVRNASPIRSPAVPNRIDRNTAVPSVPPICRKNVAEAVATPMSRGATAFCTASMSGLHAATEAEAEHRHVTIASRQNGVSTPIRRETAARRIIAACRRREHLVPAGPRDQLAGRSASRP